MARMKRFAHNNKRILMKSVSYYVMHILVAAGVAYTVTGSLAMAFALSLIEPAVQTVAFIIHEKAWSNQASSASAIPVTA